MTTEYTPPRAATLHLGGDAWAHPDLEPLVRPLYAEGAGKPIIRRHPDNPRRGDHEAIVESVRVNGVYTPPKVQRSTGYVLAGNHSFDAMLDQGATSMPWVWLDVDDDEARRIMLADNRTAELGGYDQIMLLEQVRAAAAADQLLAGTGYSSDDLAELERAYAAANKQQLTDPEDIPPPPVTPVSKVGDIWECGPHRVMCGDGNADLPLGELLAGATPNLIYTDPPYGISIVRRPSAGQGKVGGSKPVTIQGKGGADTGSPTGFDQGKVGVSNIVKTKWYAPVIGDESTATAVKGLHLCLRLYPKAKQVWWGGNHYAGDAHLTNSSCWLVWDKQTGENGFADAELAWTNHKGAVRLFTHRWAGLLRDSERGSTARVHPTQKPVALAVWAYEQMLGKKVKGAVVLDIFAGSGSALMAAEQTGAVAYLMELSPAYVDVICRRYQAATGTIPLRNGKPHDFTTT